MRGRSRVKTRQRASPTRRRAQRFQGGNDGQLARAVSTATLNTPFWGYASWWVRQAMG
jgi:hypothetical protein